MVGNIALVGCGAITQAFYLPALAKHRHAFRGLWLVDPSDRVLRDAGGLMEAEKASKLSDVRSEIDAVIVAAPNRYHCEIALEALSRGSHVLIEKPFATTPVEGEAIIAAMELNRRVVAVNQTRRFMPVAQELRKRVRAGDFGKLTAIKHHEGQKLAWPFESGAGFHRTAQRTGVIMDLGVHVLDFYQYLFEPTWTLRNAQHDGFNGPEGLADINLNIGDAELESKLSRYQTLQNVAELHFEGACIELDVYEPNQYTLKRVKGGKSRFFKAEGSVNDYISLGSLVISDFFAAIEGQQKPICDPNSSLPVIRTLDAIYTSASHYADAIGTV